MSMSYSTAGGEFFLDLLVPSDLLLSLALDDLKSRAVAEACFLAMELMVIVSRPWDWFEGLRVGGFLAWRDFLNFLTRGESGIFNGSSFMNGIVSGKSSSIFVSFTLGISFGGINNARFCLRVSRSSLSFSAASVRSSLRRCFSAFLASAACFACYCAWNLAYLAFIYSLSFCTSLRISFIWSYGNREFCTINSFLTLSKFL